MAKVVMVDKQKKAILLLKLFYLVILHVNLLYVYIRDMTNYQFVFKHLPSAFSKMINHVTDTAYDR